MCQGYHPHFTAEDIEAQQGRGTLTPRTDVDDSGCSVRVNPLEGKNHVSIALVPRQPFGQVHTARMEGSRIRPREAPIGIDPKTARDKPGEQPGIGGLCEGPGGVPGRSGKLEAVEG